MDWLYIAVVSAMSLLVVAAFVSNYLDKRRHLRIALESLRENLAAAKTWVETKPTSKEAEEWFQHAKKIHDEIEDGISKHLSPHVLLRRVVNVATEMAIQSRFRAQADKKL